MGNGNLDEMRLITSLPWGKKRQCWCNRHLHGVKRGRPNRLLPRLWNASWGLGAERCPCPSRSSAPWCGSLQVDPRKHQVIYHCTWGRAPWLPMAMRWSQLADASQLLNLSHLTSSHSIVFDRGIHLSNFSINYFSIPIPAPYSICLSIMDGCCSNHSSICNHCWPLLKRWLQTIVNHGPFPQPKFLHQLLAGTLAWECVAYCY